VVVETLTVVAKDAIENAAMAPRRARSLRLLLGTSDDSRFFHMSIVRTSDLAKNVDLVLPVAGKDGNKKGGRRVRHEPPHTRIMN
jgi:hypothetical protein